MRDGDDDTDKWDDDDPPWDTADEDAIDDATDEAATEPCPQCGDEIYDDSEQCPSCGYYLTHEDETAANKPRWVLIGVAICLVIVVTWILFG